jgi:hypothetical protein
MFAVKLDGETRLWMLISPLFIQPLPSLYNGERHWIKLLVMRHGVLDNSTYSLGFAQQDVWIVLETNNPNV